MSALAYQEKRLTAQDGLGLYYRDYGDPLSENPPLLCLGGLTRNAKDFAALAERQAPRRRVICPDYRGRGRSDYDPDWRNYRPEVYVNDLMHLMAAEDLHELVVCGVSMGGLLALGLAVAVPSALRGVILDDIGPDIGTEGLARIRDYVGRDHPQPDWEAATAEVQRLFANLGLADEAAWRAFAEATFRAGDDGQLHVDWDTNLARNLNGDRPDLWAYFRALGPLPALALRGELSDILSAKTFARMAEAKPDLIQVTVPGVGHVPAMANPFVERAIDDFLANLDRRRADD